MDIHFVVTFLCVCYVSGASVNERALDNSDLLTDLTTMDLKMRDAHPSRPDEYYCTGYKIEKDQYIVKFKGLADAGTAHHILVFGCKEPATHKDKWKCGQVCQGQEQILFAWAKNAPPLQLPKEVGRHVGPGAGIDYIVLQVHYARVFADADKPDQSGIRIYLTQKRQKFVAGIYLLLAYDTIIPANTKKVHADMSCRFDWQTSIFPFGYRTHAHKLGKVISGYRFRNESFEMIGKGNPQWPQAFYPVGKKPEEIEVKPGDVLAARCTYSSIGRNRITRIGSTHNDEMCNFYIMYYMDAAMENARGSDTCPGNNVPLVTANLPADSDTPLPPNPMLEEDAKGHVHHASVEQPSAGGPQTLEPQHVLSHKDPVPHPKMNLKFVSSVPRRDSVVFGQVGGVATHEIGRAHV